MEKRMVVHKNELRVDKVQKMRGGDGEVTNVKLAPPEVLRHLRMLSELTLPPGASIGPHVHEHETEYFVVISGQGTYNDNGVDVKVRKGDVMITGNGGTHGIANTGTAPLVFHAIIETYPAG
jgi:mannose-6-phosphate isomerase-like protein (cupin superfamily)